MRRRSVDAIAANPALKSVRISKGALGAGLPRRDLFVPRQHRVLISPKIAQRVFALCEFLAAAKGLTEIEGIDLVPAIKSVVYYHQLMRRHEVYFAEGAPLESLYLGKEALVGLAPAARDELSQIFGANWSVLFGHPPEAVRFFAKGAKIHELANRHYKNQQYLLQIHFSS